MPDAPIPRKRGNRAGIWFFRTMMRLAGLRGAYGLLYLVCPYYVWFDREAFANAAVYLARRFPEHGRRRLRRDVFRLFVEQGKNLIDRHAMVAGAFDFDLRIDGYDKMADALAEGRGCVLLTSHTGNWQAAMSALESLDRTVHLLMRPEDNAAMRDAMQVDVEKGRIQIISPDQALGGVVEMMKALEQGDIVSIMGDRTYGADGVAVDFMGEPAWFPYSAFLIAASARCPLAIMLSSKTGRYSYSVEIADVLFPSLDRKGDRKGQLRKWVQQYADILQSYLAEHPFQYFIFHDIWRDSE